MGAVTIKAATVARMSLRIGRFSCVRFVTQNNAHTGQGFQHLVGTKFVNVANTCEFYTSPMEPAPASQARVDHN
jgi:hypothetical protein